MKRIGLLVPSSNTVLEPDLTRHFGSRATVHAARMYLADPVTPAAEVAMLDDAAEPAARDLGTLQPDLVLFGCTSAGSLRGAAADRELRDRLGQICGAPVIGIFDSLGRSLRARNARRISLLTPYPAELNDSLAAGFLREGFELRDVVGLGIDSNLATGRIDPARIVDEASRMAIADSDALVIACANLRGLEAVQAVEATCGIEVVTSNSAAIEAVEEAISWPR